MLYPNTDAMIVTITRGNQWWTHVFSFMQNGLVETRPRKIVRYSSRWSPPRKSLVKGERFVREWRKPRADKFKSEWQVDRSWQMKLVVSLALCAPEKIAPRQGIEPWSPAWQAGILTTILSRIACLENDNITNCVSSISSRKKKKLWFLCYIPIQTQWSLQ